MKRLNRIEGIGNGSLLHVVLILNNMYVCMVLCTYCFALDVAMIIAGYNNKRKYI